MRMDKREIGMGNGQMGNGKGTGGKLIKGNGLKDKDERLEINKRGDQRQ